LHSYGEDLAYIHDAGHGDFARRAAPALLGLLRRRGLRSGLVVDLGCGTGIWAEALVRAGYDVLGIDWSAAMIALARRRASAARFRRASFLDFPLPRCAAVTAIGEVLNYRFDPRCEPRALARFFGRIHRALAPGGLLIFDVLGRGHARDGPIRRWRQGEDWAVLSEIEERRRFLVRRITTFRRVGSLFRRRREVHHVRLFDLGAVERDLRHAGFAVRRLRGYGGLRFAAAHAGFAARKLDRPSIAGVRS